MFRTELEQVKQEAEQVVVGVQENSGATSQSLLRAYVPPQGMLEIVQQNNESDVSVTGGEEDLNDHETEFYEMEVSEVRTMDDTPYGFVAIPIVWSGGEVASLQLTESMEAEAENLELLRVVLLGVTILAFIPLFLSARLLSNVITKPIASLTQTMNSIRTGGTFQRIDTSKRSRDELYHMTETFNKMIDQLEANYTRQEQFVSNASHELKTPLTIIESYLSLLKRRGKNDEALFDESVDAALDEAKRMRELTQQLLLLSKQDEQWNMEWMDHDLNDLLQSTINAFEKAYERSVLYEATHSVTVKTDEQKVKQLLYIFMDNARKYSEAPLEVRLDRVEDQARITITDYGIGISKDHLGNVFDRFYQVDEARTRASGGYGLGLSLAQELARVLGAEIRLDSDVGKGTTATILLPLSYEGRGDER